MNTTKLRTFHLRKKGSSWGVVLKGDGTIFALKFVPLVNIFTYFSNFRDIRGGEFSNEPAAHYTLCFINHTHNLRAWINCV